MKTTTNRFRILIALLAVLGVASAGRADDKDLLKSGTSHPNVMVILSNTDSMKFLPYVQGSTANFPTDGQNGDSPVSKFGLAKGAFRAIVGQNSSRFNFGLSWYSYHQESVSHKFFSYQFTSNVTIPGAAFDYPGDTFKEAVGTYEEWGTTGGGPILTPGTDATAGTFGIAGTTTVSAAPWFDDKPAAATCAANTCQGYAIEQIAKAIRVAVHLVPVGGGQPYGQLTVQVIKFYQLGTPAANPNTWTTQANTPTGKPGTVTLNYSASVSTSPSFPNTFTTGSDSGLYMGFMKSGDWNLNSDCGGWFVKNSLPAVGPPRDYNSDLSCALTTCAQPPENSVGCVLRYTRPQSAVIHYAPGANGVYSAVNPPDDVPNNCSATVVHTGAAVTDQVTLITDHDSHIPESNMFKNADDYFNGTDCFVNGIRSDDPNKTCRTGAIILLSDTFNACGPDCGQNATAKYLVALKNHHVNVYVIAFGVPKGSAQDTEAHCIATTSGSEITGRDGVFYVNSTDPAQVAIDLTNAFNTILTIIDEATEDFASASVSSVQAGNGQMAFLATFNARKSRSIWDGALRGYKLLPSGSINPAPVSPDTHSQNTDGTDCISIVRDPNDPQVNATLDVPCNQLPVLRWNAQINLAAVPLTSGGTPSGLSGVADIAASATLTTGSTYSDTTNETAHPIPIYNYSGRRILWSLPSTVVASGTVPTTLPINGASAAATERVPETTEPFLLDRVSYWTAPYWPALKMLFTQQTSPPTAGVPVTCATPPCASDISARQTVRFIRGDRDSVINELHVPNFTSPDPHFYTSGSLPFKLGDIFHSNPVLLAEPENVFYFDTNRNNYQDFFTRHQHRRRVLYTGANDGLLHAFDVGVWNRTTGDCTGGATSCYDFGTGAELFAYAPRSIMQVAQRLKDAVGAQSKTNEWTVDGSPSAADMFIDANHNGTPVPASRGWHTVLVGTMREGSAFEGQTPCPPSGTTTAFQNSASSVYALDVTQPEPFSAGIETFGSSAAPGCLDGGANCPAAWPKVLWEIQDANDADSNGYPDMGESWSKPALGRICLAKDSSGNCTDERYVAIFGGGFDRERKNRRGNFFYIVDVETGFVLYKTSSGVANFAGSNSSVNFASIPAGTTGIDVNNDGLLDYVYFGDLLGQMWRLDLRDMKMGAGAPTDRWSSKLTKTDGTALSAFLLFQAPQPVGGSTKYYPIYYRPDLVYLGTTSPGNVSLGVAFGTGDRDDITALCDATTRSTAYNQRFYFVVDKSNTTTVTESTSGMLQIATSSSANTSTTPSAGWYMLMGTSNATLAERLITDVLVANQYIYFFTQSPVGSGSSGSGTCPPPSSCTTNAGAPRQYTMFYANGNYPLGATDRGVAVPNAAFATNPVFYISANQAGNVAFVTNHGGFTQSKNVQPPQSNLRAWKEN